MRSAALDSGGAVAHGHTTGMSAGLVGQILPSSLRMRTAMQAMESGLGGRIESLSGSLRALKAEVVVVADRRHRTSKSAPTGASRPGSDAVAGGMHAWRTTMNGGESYGSAPRLTTEDDGTQAVRDRAPVGTASSAVRGASEAVARESAEAWERVEDVAESAAARAHVMSEIAAARVAAAGRAATGLSRELIEDLTRAGDRLRDDPREFARAVAVSARARASDLGAGAATNGIRLAT